MPIITIQHKGSFDKANKTLRNLNSLNPKVLSIFNAYGERGVSALSSATPQDSGLTAQSWKYEVKHTARGYELVWYNTNVVDGVSIAILLQYGHGTGNGGYVVGRDYINPAMRPIFDDIATKINEEVSKL